MGREGTGAAAAAEWVDGGDGDELDLLLLVDYLVSSRSPSRLVVPVTLSPS